MKERERMKAHRTREILPSDRWHDAEDLKWTARSWASRIGVKVPQIYIRQMTTKWASISTSGHLTLNAELLDIPKSLGEFVVVHEIVHILVPNHGPVFKSFLHAYMPDWLEREKCLRSLEKDRLKEKRLSD
jgi:predicted metal-dependent hydrolase